VLLRGKTSVATASRATGESSERTANDGRVSGGERRWCVGVLDVLLAVVTLSAGRAAAARPSGASPKGLGRANGSGQAGGRREAPPLGSILQRAMEGERIARNPARIVRKVKRAPRREVRPLAPVTVEKLRAASRERDAALISVLAYAGLRPQEALALCWATSVTARCSSSAPSRSAS
jgi:hypothetical protein